ncbi:excinuclease ABC subunit C [Enterococcus faecalis]
MVRVPIGNFCTVGALTPKTTSIAYVQCACGCLASRMSSDSDKYKCSWCKRTYMLGKEIYR